MRKDTYLKAVLDEMPRILANLDRNPFSKTYGCFDRDYWHNTFTDFPCARKQEAVLTLAILYKLNSGKNPYFNKKEM